MSNKEKHVKKIITTAVELATMNSRNDDSLSFTSGGQLIAEDSKNDHKARIVATSDGKVWIQPANGGSQIDLTQATLSEAQLSNVNDIPNISNELRKNVEPTLKNQVLPALEKHLSLINDRSTIAVNDVQDKRLDLLETDVKRLDTLESSITNIPTTSIRITNANQNLNPTGNAISTTSNTQLSNVLQNLVARMIGMRNNFSVLPVTLTSSSAAFMVPQTLTPANFNVATSPGRSRLHRVRHIRMTSGATTHNSTPMVDNTNSVNHFYTSDNLLINNNATARMWHSIGRMTLSIGTATHSVNIRSFSGSSDNSTPSNRNATIRTTDSWVPTFMQGWSVEYYKESEQIIKDYENKIKEIDDIQSKQDEEYCKTISNNPIYKEYNGIILWFDNYFEKELKLKNWQGDYKPSYDDTNKQSYDNWEHLQQCASDALKRKEELQPQYENLMVDLLDYHNKAVDNYATRYQEIQKERHEKLEECAKKHNPNYVGNGYYEDGSCDDWVNEK